MDEREVMLERLMGVIGCSSPRWTTEMARAAAQAILDGFTVKAKPQDDPRDVEAAKAMHARYTSFVAPKWGSVSWKDSGQEWREWLISEARREREALAVGIHDAYARAAAWGVMK